MSVPYSSTKGTQATSFKKQLTIPLSQSHLSVLRIAPSVLQDATTYPPYPNVSRKRPRSHRAGWVEMSNLFVLSLGCSEI